MSTGNKYATCTFKRALGLPEARSQTTVAGRACMHPATSLAEAQSTRRVYGVLRHVLANGSASFQSHPNHANTFRPNPADRAIPHTKDLRAETGSFGAFKPNTFTCARFFFYISRT